MLHFKGCVRCGGTLKDSVLEKYEQECIQCGNVVYLKPRFRKLRPVKRGHGKRQNQEVDSLIKVGEFKPIEIISEREMFNPF
jgi:DNA-directed RNA polymerase subunit RPC12/RpoP